MSINLSNSYLERDAIRAPNFFNGRLLSAEDMSAERGAQRRMLTRLGRANGHGIAYGLEVSGPLGGSTNVQPVVTVSPGLAINREGQAIELNQAIDVSLLEPANTNPVASTGTNGKGGRFAACDALSTSAYAVGKGVYLLTVAPAEGREGRALASGLGNLTVCCGDKSVVEGLSFRLIRLEVAAADLDDARLQNRLAHRCFGSSDSRLASFASNPFGPPVTEYGVLDELRGAGKLNDLEVPLALSHWVNGAGTRFIDPWSVRRRIIQPAALAGPWGPVLDDRRDAEQESMFLQFQAHLASWPLATRRTAIATEHFDYLPPAGVLPLSVSSTDAGFDYLMFFKGLTVRDQLLYVEGARLRWLLRMARDFPPLALTSGTEAKKLIWLYLVRENRQASATSAQTQAYMVFARGDVPYVADPHYDVNHWSFANYALNGGSP